MPIGRSALLWMLLVLTAGGPAYGQHLTVKAERIAFDDTFWERTAPRYGWEQDGRDVELVSETSTEATTHRTYRQTVSGLPVVNGYVRVSTDRQGLVSMVSSSFRKLDAVDAFDPKPGIPSEVAVQRARRAAASGDARRNAEPVLSVVASSGEPRLVWRVIVWPYAEGGEWEVLVDARSGDVVSATDQSLSHRTDGSGFVFDPDPLYSSGSSYGGAYVDGSDATNPALDAERRTVALRDLSQDGLNRYVLTGPHVDIVGETLGGLFNYSPPAEALPDGFRYNRSEAGFEAVMAYYHVDASQRYVQELGFSDRQNLPLRIHPRAFQVDDSRYNPAGNMIEFGTGGVDDAEDATVIWHEYAHALLEAAAPGLSTSLEGRAMHEGWADYWAMSYVRSKVESGELPQTDWRRVFAWDSGDGTIWRGRYIAFQGTYPQATFCDDPPPTSQCNVYEDGLLLATALMEVQDDLGRVQTDKLVLHAQAYLGRSSTMRDFGEAMVQADADHFGGAHIPTLVSVLGRWGLVNASSFGPLVSHDPLPGTDNLGGMAEVVVQATGVADPVAQVTVTGSSSTEGPFSIQLTAGPDGTYSGSFPLPSEADSVFYYVDVVDAGGRHTLLPSGAPAERYAFLVANDLHAPEVQHVPLASGNMATWPEVVRSTVTDNFSVASVEVDYDVVSVSGAVLASGMFALSRQGSEYQAAFPVPFSDLQKDAEVRYRIRARDSAVPANETVDPASGWHAFTIVADGELRSVSSSDPGIVLSGLFRTAPFAGQVPGGGQVLTVPTTATAAGMHVADLPPVDLTGLGEAWLSFWYRIDTPFTGDADPWGSGNVISPEGGVVQLARGAAGAWETIAPAGGYPAIISQAGGTALSGSPAFGGYGHGWRIAHLALPVGDRVRVRLVYASDATPTPDHAGWQIADIRYATVPRVDVAPPVVLSTVFEDVLRITADGPPVLMPSVSVSDDLGVTEAFVDYRLGFAPLQTSRLDQDTHNLTSWRGIVGDGADAVPGDLLSFRVRVRDASGSEALYPADGSWLEARYVLSAERDLLAGAQSSTAWMGSTVRQTDVLGPVASLHLVPFTVPANPEASRLTLRHSHFLPGGSGATVQVSTNDGRTWTNLEPMTGYDGDVTVDETHPYAGVEGFLGSAQNRISAFDLSSYAGQRVLVRFLFLTDVPGSSSGTWSLHEVSVRDDTRDAAFEIPTVFSLDTIHPNPFRTSATVSFSVASDGHVLLDVSDTLGRRVARLVDGQLGAGSHAVSLDGAGLSAGVYVIRLVADGRAATRTIVRQ